MVNAPAAGAPDPDAGADLSPPPHAAVAARRTTASVFFMGLFRLTSA
jgi:hypothetical protein